MFEGVAGWWIQDSEKQCWTDEHFLEESDSSSTDVTFSSGAPQSF